MTPGNFNWFIHTMLFYHTKYVLEKQRHKQMQEDEGKAEESDEESEEESEEESD